MCAHVYVHVCVYVVCVRVRVRLCVNEFKNCVLPLWLPISDYLCKNQVTVGIMHNVYGHIFQSCGCLQEFYFTATSLGPLLFNLAVPTLTVPSSASCEAALMVYTTYD